MVELAGRARLAGVDNRTLDEVRADAASAAAAEFGLRLAAGAPYGGQRVQIDDGSRANLTALAVQAQASLQGQPWPDGYARGWIAMGGTRIPLAEPADGFALAQATGSFYATLVQHEQDLIDAINAATDAVGVAAVDVTAGWPS